MAGTCSVIVPPGGRCRFHGTTLSRSPDGPGQRGALRRGATRATSDPRPASEAISRRDIGEVCWLIVKRALDDPGGDGKGASVAVSALRILVGLPPAGQTAEAARKEAFLRGKVMHGIAPQTAEEWALAEEIFEEKAIEEFRRWELWERDDGYVDEPLGLGELARDEPQTPAVIDQED